MTRRIVVKQLQVVLYVWSHAHDPFAKFFELLASKLEELPDGRGVGDELVLNDSWFNEANQHAFNI